jgi:hypothetical protein
VADAVLVFLLGTSQGRVLVFLLGASQGRLLVFMLGACKAGQMLALGLLHAA